MTDVLFAVLPFAAVDYPSLGVSLLQAHLKRRGFTARTEYFNIKFAAQLGIELYRAIELGCPMQGTHEHHTTEPLAGEWFFADEVFEGKLPDAAEYVSRFLEPDRIRRQYIGQIIEARSRAGIFIERCVQDIRSHSAPIVAFTTTFDQTCACLAVAKKLKALDNPPIIVFGGANCEGEMGMQLIRSFEWIDYVCTGEGDEALPQLVDALARSKSAVSIPGIVKRDGEYSVPQPVMDMDSLPVPDFHDFFDTFDSSMLRQELRPYLMMETSRGCWWGMKQHCTFCGLNGGTMVYRSKSPERVLQEMEVITRTYGTNKIECTDNILDLKYLHTLFPSLIEKKLKLDIYFEIKANIRLDQLRMLYAAGVQTLLPGIESLSNEVLRLMRKGCSALQNIQVLRWCEEIGIISQWNLLYGFPGEPPSEYERMAALIPLLTHLRPPFFCIPVRLDRFSPYFTQSHQLGVTNVRPAGPYEYIFPLERSEVHRLAYYFEFDHADGRNPLDYTAAVRREVLRWAELVSVPPPEERPQLDLYQTGDLAFITDTRACAVDRLHVLSGLEAEVYMLCDEAHTVNGIRRITKADEPVVRRLLEGMVDARIMIEIEGQYLSLAVMRRRVTASHDRSGAAQPEEIDAHGLVNIR